MIGCSVIWPEEQIKCVFDVIIYLEKLSIQFALLKTLSIFDTDRCQGKFYHIDRV